VFGSSTSSTTSAAILATGSYTAPTFWYRANRRLCGVVWIALHLKAGELVPEVAAETNLYGQSAVAALSASTWSWLQ